MHVLVMGRAKSGTTAISKSILDAMGERAEMIFEPHNIESFQETRTESDSVTKMLFDHWLDDKKGMNCCINNQYALKFDKRVLIVRDPRDQIISALMYQPYDLKRAGHPPARFREWIDYLRQKEKAPGSMSFVDMCRKFDSLFDVNFFPSLNHFQTLNLGYYPFCQRMAAEHVVIRYEDFMRGEVGLLSKYLKLQVSASPQVNHKYAQTYRSGAYDNWKRYFTPDDVEFFFQYEQQLAAMGYSDWELTPVESIPGSELSGYVSRLLD